MEHLTEAFLTDGLTAREQTELQQLLKVAENKAYFKEMYMLWYAANHKSDKENVEQAIQRILFRINGQQRRKRTNHEWLFSFRKMAAAVFISFVLGALLFYIINGTSKSESLITSLETSKVTTPLGSRSQVELPDGTLVTLNAGSNLRYQTSFGRQSREVWLEGEGYFKVVKNTSVPFIVKAKDVTIKALGTEFNVKAYPEEKTVQTTLVNGSVSVRQTNAPGNAEEIMLKPKQTVTIYEQTATAKVVQDEMKQPAVNRVQNQIAENVTAENVELKKEINTDLYTSWKDDRWVIESELLSDLAMKLQRRFDVQIIIADDALKQYPFNGILADETLEQVLEIMKSIAPINYSINKKTVTLKINPHQRKFFDELMKK